MTNTGEIIRMCRDSLHWTRQYLSEKSGVPVGTILNCERHDDCRMSTFEKLLDAMDFEVEILKKESIFDSYRSRG